MDRLQTLRLLRAGPLGLERWNAARAAGVAPPPLDGADLQGAFLEDADLRGADLRGANLAGATLPSAWLGGALLSGADLTDADLYRTDLCGANLRGARLVGAQLTRTLLAGADLDLALFGDTLVDCDLSEALNLGSVRHSGPSDISYGTLLDFRGRMPERFLSGCAVARSFLRMARLERADVG